VSAQYCVFSTSINRGEVEAFYMAFSREELLCMRVVSLKRRKLWKFVNIDYFVHDIIYESFECSLRIE
jgi:hypothetical protein